MIVLGDGGPIHKGPDVREAAGPVSSPPRRAVSGVRAPKLNPDEFVWAYLKTALANGCPLNVEALLDDLTHLTRRLRRSQRRLRGFVLGSDLPPLFSS